MAQIGGVGTGEPESSPVSIGVETQLNTLTLASLSLGGLSVGSLCERIEQHQEARNSRNQES